MPILACHVSRRRRSPQHSGQRSLGLIAALVAVASIAPVRARAQDAEPLSLTAYNPAMLGSTGLINNPVSWVSRENGALFVALTMRQMYEGSWLPKPNGSAWDATMSIETHLGGFLALGATMYESSSQQVGLNAQIQALKQPQDSRWMPAISIGVRNVGASNYQDRYVTGYGRVLDAVSGGKTSGKGLIKGGNSFYGVMTREWEHERSTFGATLGYGVGMFKNDGGLGSAYNTRGTIVPGLFFGGRYAYRLSEQRIVSVIAEDDGWDINAGVQLAIGHLSVGLGLSEIEEQKQAPRGYPIANWTKVNVMLGYSTSFAGITRGTRARREAIDLELERRRLAREVTQREQRMRELDAQIAKAKQKADAESLAQQAALQKALEAEREAAKKAQERLNKKPEGN